MATLSFPKVEIEKSLKLKIDEKLIDKIMMSGIPASLSGDLLEIEILPNRPDILSMQGFLRVVKGILGKELGLKKYKINASEKNYKVKIDSSLKDIRPFTACAIVKGIKFDDAKIKEIIDMQEKLHATAGRNRKKFAIGIYPLEKIKLPIKFEARYPKDIKFIPLEFDKEINGIEILQRHPTGRDYAHLLEGKNKFPIFVDGDNKILSMPPIINSHETGKISKKTEDVFIECSGFDFRFLNKILNIIVTTLAEMSGKVYAMELDYAGKKEITPNFTPESMKISLENTNKLLGLELKEKDLEKLLSKMGYDYKSGKAYIPAWRTDILHEVDIIEDIAIAYGYEKITPEIPKVATIGLESRKSKLIGKISDIISGLGLLEVSSYHLIKEEEAEKIKLQDKIEIENSKTEYKTLRPNLLISALRILSENKDHEYPQKIFELGSVFKKSLKSETGIQESEHLIIAITPGNFTEIKQILEYLSKMLSIQLTIKESIHPQLIEGRTAEISFNEKSIGFIGEVNPKTLRDFNIKMPIAFLEISLEEIFGKLNS